ncbi:MAG: single-stranded-DNA-specific exonuclease RecJ [Deltaproteobacteria bacterium]|nr:single-stranded-DNA-specific exonuclease RecJ [Deltaproteobacteria bacterium]
MDKLWEIRTPRPEMVQQLAREARIDPILATLLVNRGIFDPAEAETFMSPRLNDLRPPFALKDAPEAARRILQALVRREKILIFGDYDVDGVTSAVVVHDFLKSLGADVSVYIPHRVREGYGLKPEHVTRYIAPEKFNLVITVDCGSGSHEAVTAAARHGIDVIITDHHRVDTPLPKAVAVVNPNRPDCSSGFGHLAGVGVAYFLVIVLRKHLRDTGLWKNGPEPNLKAFCDLVALGTVADMAPMIRENRILTREGLTLIQSGRRIPLRALAESSGTGYESMDAEGVAFRLSPRINAAGRIDHAELAFDLLRETHLHAAREKAGRLNTLNSHRQRLEKQILDAIDHRIQRRPEILKNRTLVLWDPDWHEGVLGIVASKVVEKYHRMAVLFSTRDGMGKGSARGVPGLDLFGFLGACRECIEDFGGHETAAGLKVRSADLESFTEAFETTVRGKSRPEDFIPRILIDCELDFDQITTELADALEQLKPHGVGNPSPLFFAKNIRVLSSRVVGKSHRKMRLCQYTGGRSRILDAIQFNIDPDRPKPEAFSRMAFRLSWNHWNGQKTLQAVVQEAE